MKKYLFLSWFSFFCGITSQGQSPRHVILISIDGMRPAFYLDSTWPAPNLQWLAQKGVCAKRMKSVFPSYTYPAHAAMLTGALPARSGIYYNAPFEPMGASGNWNWWVTLMKSPTLWQALRSRGMVTSAVQWPVSVGDQIDYNIPEIWSNSNPADRIRISRQYASKGLVEEVEQFATGQLNQRNMNEKYLSLDENASRMAAYIFSNYKPHFLALHFAGVDGAQHANGTTGLPVKLAVAAIDRAIGNVMEAVERSAAKDSTAIIIVGDHGFADYHTVIKPNIWLLQKGLLQSGQHWRARFQPAGGSAFFYLEQPSDTATTAEILQLLSKLPLEERRHFSVINRRQLHAMGVDSNVVFALSAQPGYVFSGATSGSVVSSAKGGHHGYDPNLPQMMTGFIGSGTGFKAQTHIDELHICDIPGIIAALLDVPFSSPDSNGDIRPLLLVPKK